MVSGQQLDLDAEGLTLRLDDIGHIHSQKTGALIAAAARSGAIIGGAHEPELAAIELYGRKLGLLFQITDDLLDVTQPTEKLGKTAGKDAAAKKATYPSLLGIDETRRLAAEVHDESAAALSSLGRDTALLRGLADLILNRTR
jgi:geranylgeranyl diphosphate synthase type II